MFFIKELIIIARIKKKLYKHSVEIIVEEYLNDCINRNLSSRTIELYKAHLDSFSMHIGVGYLEDITQEILNCYLSNLNQWHNYSPTSYNNHCRFIRAFFNYAREKEYMGKLKVTYKKIDSKIQFTPDDLEVKRIIERPSLDVSYSYLSAWLACMIIVSTGTRVGAISNLKKSNVDLKGGTIIFTKTKQRKEMIVKMTPKLKKAISFFLDVTETNSEYLICQQYTEEKLSDRVLSNNVKRFCASRGVPQANAHSLRRYFSCSCLLSGMSIFELSRHLGHSSLEVTQTYVKSLSNLDFEDNFMKMNPLERLKG